MTHASDRGLSAPGVTGNDLGSRPLRKFQYNVEIVGVCNLRCPSCPVGNMGLSGRPSGLMDPEYFREVVAKIVRETPGRETTVALYDWGEPSLHPDLPGFIEILREAGLRSRISSNLNTVRSLEPVVKASPDEFHISLSGFYEENYSQTHARGDIEKVKANLRNLARWKADYGARTEFTIGFHVYRHNLARDLPAMRRLAEELGFAIEPVVAQYFPIEKRLAWLEQLRGDAPTLDGLEITASDRRLIDLLLVKPEETDRWYRRLPGFTRRRLEASCERQDHKMSIRVDGSVPLCCVTYDRRLTAAESFLDKPHEALQQARMAHSFCGTCMRNGLHVMPGGLRQRLAELGRGRSRLAGLAGRLLGAGR